MSDNSRVPAGVPTGGQFAASAKPEAAVALASPRDRFPRDADGAIDAYAAVREGFISGFAPHASTEPITKTMVGHWDGNTIVVEYVDHGAHEDERNDTGQWPEGLWSDSATGVSDVEIAATMLDTYTEAHAIRVAHGDWDYTDAEDEGEAEDESCAFEGCDDDLSDNEGYDGHCGHHAEKVEAHEDGEHNDYNGTDSDPDCPLC